MYLFLSIYLCYLSVVCILPLARFVQKVVNVIQQINHYLADSMVCFVNFVDCDLSGG